MKSSGPREAIEALALKKAQVIFQTGYAVSDDVLEDHAHYTHDDDYIRLLFTTIDNNYRRIIRDSLLNNQLTVIISF